MFAGAAREVVFSKKNIVAQIQNNFVPVALKAGLVNNPPQGIEGTLYREINRTKAAPQGICVMNSGGKILDWVLGFDNDQSIEKFFDDVVDRYKQFPSTEKTFATQRYRSYPGKKMREIADSGKTISIPSKHTGDDCPGKPKIAAGTLIGKIVGRPLDQQGKPIKKTLHQEDYMEATFDVSKHAQTDFISAMRKTEAKKFRVPDSFVEEIVSPAYLGQLDVSPLEKVPTGKNTDSRWEFTAERIDGNSAKNLKSKPILLRIIGRSHIAGAGNQWDHRVTLDWQGYVEIEGDLVSRLDMLAVGRERLRWHTNNLSLINNPASATLMGGHPIDLNSPVKYGLNAKNNSPAEK